MKRPRFINSNKNSTLVCRSRFVPKRKRYFLLNAYAKRFDLKPAYEDVEEVQLDWSNKSTY